MNSDSASLTMSECERQQFPLLLRHFVRRLFENDLVPDTVDLRQSIIWLAAIFATPPLLIAIRLMPKYAVLVQVSPELFDVASWPDKLFFLGYSMTAVGFLTVLVWDALFPDQRDAMVLGSLPVRDRTVLAAKMTALVVFIVGFAVAINIPAAVGFALAIGGYGSVLRFPHYVLAHVVATVAAGTFVFLSLIALQATLVILLPQRMLRAISVVAQLVFVIVLIEWWFFSPGLLIRLAADELGPNRLPENLPPDLRAAALANAYRFFADIVSDGTGAWLPPMWFLGVNEVLLGIDRLAFQPLATTAVLGMAATLGLALAAYAASYRRIVHRALETPQPAARRLGLAPRLVRRVTFATILRHPIEQAVVEFVAKSLARSRRHRLIIAVYIGVGLAFIIGSFLGPVIRGLELSLTERTVALLSIPLVLSFFTLVALRVLFTVPTELSANWIFQLTESDDKRRYLSGVRKAMLLLGLAPIALITLPMYWMLWGIEAAVGHTVFWLLLGIVLVELLLIRFHKVPFTCSYVPGKANVKLLWPAYLFAMTTYAYSSARLEIWLLAEPARWVIGCIVAVGGLAAVATYRRRVRAASVQFTYDETIDPTVQVLHLMRPV